MLRKAISTDTAPSALGPYSQAIVANGFVFCSGTVGIQLPALSVTASRRRPNWRCATWLRS
jgi:enamine deaminase RidA (YjgF/YER057c/UK114 family)